MLGFPFWGFFFGEDFVDEKQEGMKSQTRGRSGGQTWPQFKENSNELWIFLVGISTNITTLILFEQEGYLSFIERMM
jgi:hypothetical protein